MNTKLLLSGNEALQNAAAHMLAYGAKLTPQMRRLPAGTPPAALPRAGEVW